MNLGMLNKAEGQELLSLQSMRIPNTLCLSIKCHLREAAQHCYSIGTPITRESSIFLLKLCSIAKNAVKNVPITFKLIDVHSSRFVISYCLIVFSQAICIA